MLDDNIRKAENRKRKLGINKHHTFVHKDNKIALLPMTPEQILKNDIARGLELVKRKNRSNKRVKIRL